MHPQPRVEKMKPHERSHHRSTEITRHSRTQWFYGLCRALPGDEFVLSPSSADMDCLSPVGPTRLRQLDTSNGCQDHTVLPSAAVYAKGFDGLGTRPPNFSEGGISVVRLRAVD